MMRTATRSDDRAILGALALGAAALMVTAAPAAAGSGEPDLGHYCRAHHGLEAQAAFHRGRGEWACVEQRGFERRYHRVDFAEACRLTFGASGFRPAGAGVICLGTAADGEHRNRGPAAPGGRRHAYRQVIPDLSGYCHSTYGRHARVAFDRATSLYVCAIPRTRRGGTAFRRIDMASACYYTVHTTNYRFDGDRREIRCLVSV